MKVFRHMMIRCQATTCFEKRVLDASALVSCQEPQNQVPYLPAEGRKEDMFDREKQEPFACRISPAV